MLTRVEPRGLAFEKGTEMDDSEIVQKAATLQLAELAAEHEADLRKALANGAALAEKVPTDLHWSEEPVHTFALPAHSKEAS